MITVLGTKTSEKAIRKIDVQRPSIAGRTWQGIRHGDLIDGIRNEIDSRGWKVSNEQFALSKDQGDIVGAFDLKIPRINVPEGMSLAVGFVSSNMLRRRLKLAVGASVACCLNGMVTGEIVLAKKHCRGLDLGDALTDGMDEYLLRSSKVTHTVTAMRETEVSDAAAEHLLMEAGRAGLMPWSRIGEVDKEFRNPTFAEHGKNTAWSLLQAFTFIVKRNPVLRQMEQMRDFQSMLTSRLIAV